MRSLPRQATLPALLVGLVCLAGAVLGYLTAPDRSETPSLAAAANVGAGQNSISGIIESIEGDILVLSSEDGPQRFKLTDGTKLERLRPAGLSAVSAGDWLNIGGESNSRTLLKLTGLVIIPAALVSAP